MKQYDYMGNTPIVKIDNIYGQKYANVFVKLEEFNPGGSIKSRVAYQMICDAEEKGLLNKGSHIIEATGGNTGLGLAFISALKGYKLTLVIPDNFSQEKINVLKNYGANIILSDHKTGVGSHLKLRNSMLEGNNKYICLDQFNNFSNPKAHYLGTANEIIQDLNGKIDIFVAGIGSGGTVGGIGLRLKEYNSNIRVIGVHPKGCDYFNNIFIPHKIEAISVGVISPFFKNDLLSDLISIGYEEVVEFLKLLASSQGIFVGLSSGANILAALKISQQYDSKVNIVTVAPDSGKSYLNHFA